MPIRIPNDLPAAETLKQENIFVMTQQRGDTQNIRPLELLLLNLMPTKVATETQLSRLLGQMFHKDIGISQCKSPFVVTTNFSYHIIADHTEFILRYQFVLQPQHLVAHLFHHHLSFIGKSLTANSKQHLRCIRSKVRSDMVSISLFLTDILHQTATEITSKHRIEHTHRQVIRVLHIHEKFPHTYTALHSILLHDYSITFF